MITSTSGIYGEIFRLLAFVIDELDKVQFGWEASPCSPHLDPFTRFSIFFEPTAMTTVTSSESFIPF